MTQPIPAGPQQPEPYFDQGIGMWIYPDGSMFDPVSGSWVTQYRPDYTHPPVVNQQVVYGYNGPVYVPRKSCPHVMHAVLTLLTCGLWLPIWIIDAIAKSG
ncbi:hypothetical protein GTV32_02715 [Gordonia sp. SID5947]|uniref:hypothetical protein n=1 Tax=Gordonia sp. SID5947 TaxID=2690315 RepID=UPI00136A5670|nr:hypothetical protein [Gordonia sp. SID5947]MYR05297.1 hypothetical protein [Gordonia sp. SID5947]